MHLCVCECNHKVMKLHSYIQEHLLVYFKKCSINARNIEHMKAFQVFYCMK